MVRQVEPEEVAGRIASGQPVHLLDVRQAWEHEMRALPASQLIPPGELSARAGEIRPGSEALLLVYCHHGIRSLSAAALLEHLGHRNVDSLAGGIDAWSCRVDSRIPRY